MVEVLRQKVGILKSIDPDKKNIPLWETLDDAIAAFGNVLPKYIEGAENAINLEPSYIHPLFEFNPEHSSIQIDNEIIPLTQTETTYLRVFTRNPNRPVPRKTLERVHYDFNGLFAYGDPINARNRVDVYIRRLRKKINNGRELDSPIHTLRGVGFMLVDESRKNVNNHKPNE